MIGHHREKKDSQDSEQVDPVMKCEVEEADAPVLASSAAAFGFASSSDSPSHADLLNVASAIGSGQNRRIAVAAVRQSGRFTFRKQSLLASEVTALTPEATSPVDPAKVEAEVDDEPSSSQQCVNHIISLPKQSRVIVPSPRLPLSWSPLTSSSKRLASGPLGFCLEDGTSGPESSGGDSARTRDSSSSPFLQTSGFLPRPTIGRRAVSSTEPRSGQDRHLLSSDSQISRNGSTRAMSAASGGDSPSSAAQGHAIASGLTCAMRRRNSQPCMSGSSGVESPTVPAPPTTAPLSITASQARRRTSSLSSGISANHRNQNLNVEMQVESTSETLDAFAMDDTLKWGHSHKPLSSSSRRSRKMGHLPSRNSKDTSSPPSTSNLLEGLSESTSTSKMNNLGHDPTAMGSGEAKMVRRRRVDLLPRPKAHLRVAAQLSTEDISPDLLTELEVHRRLRSGPSALPLPSPTVGMPKTPGHSALPPAAWPTSYAFMYSSENRPKSSHGATGKHHHGVGGSSFPTPNRFPEQAVDDEDEGMQEDSSASDEGAQISNSNPMQCFTGDGAGSETALSTWGGMEGSDMEGSGWEDDAEGMEKRASIQKWKRFRGGGSGSSIGPTWMTSSPSSSAPILASPSHHMKLTAGNGGEGEADMFASAPSTMAAQASTNLPQYFSNGAPIPKVAKRKLTDMERYEPFSSSSFKRRAISPSASIAGSSGLGSPVLGVTIGNLVTPPPLPSAMSLSLPSGSGPSVLAPSCFTGHQHHQNMSTHSLMTPGLAGPSGMSSLGISTANSTPALAGTLPLPPPAPIAAHQAPANNFNSRLLSYQSSASGLSTPQSTSTTPSSSSFFSNPTSIQSLPLPLSLSNTTSQTNHSTLTVVSNPNALPTFPKWPFDSSSFSNHRQHHTLQQQRQQELTKQISSDLSSPASLIPPPVESGDAITDQDDIIETNMTFD